MGALLLVLSITESVNYFVYDRCTIVVLLKQVPRPSIRRMVNVMYSGAVGPVPPLLALLQDNNRLTINLSGGRAFLFSPS